MLRRRLLTAGLAALALGALPASAQADPATEFAVGSAPFQVAQQIARTHWGREACNGQVDLRWVTLAPLVNATASWTNPKTAYDNPELNGDCRIDFNATMDFDFTKFCTVVVHEYGHLNGQPHSPDIHDLMAPIYLDPLAACASAGPRQAALENAPMEADEDLGDDASAPSPVARPAKAKAQPRKAAKKAKKAKKSKRSSRKRKASRARARMASVAPRRQFTLAG